MYCFARNRKTFSFTLQIILMSNYGPAEVKTQRLRTESCFYTNSALSWSLTEDKIQSLVLHFAYSLFATSKAHIRFSHLERKHFMKTTLQFTVFFSNFRVPLCPGFPCRWFPWDILFTFPFLLEETCGYRNGRYKRYIRHPLLRLRKLRLLRWPPF